MDGARRTTRDGSDAAQLGAELGERATLVQFSSAFCQPCRATRRVLARWPRMVDGVAHVEIDAEAHLDLVRELDIIKTPDRAGPRRGRAGSSGGRPGSRARRMSIAALGEAV